MYRNVVTETGWPKWPNQKVTYPSYGIAKWAKIAAHAGFLGRIYSYTSSKGVKLWYNIQNDWFLTCFTLYITPTYLYQPFTILFPRQFFTYNYTTVHVIRSSFNTITHLSLHLEFYRLCIPALEDNHFFFNVYTQLCLYKCSHYLLPCNKIRILCWGWGCTKLKSLRHNLKIKMINH